jgi:hypothetical protein
MNRAVIGEGLRAGGVLAGCAVVLAVLGLAPLFSWIPEVLLVGTAILLPVAILWWVGARGASRSGDPGGGALAGSIAGAIGGCVGGLAYVAFGKPALNVMVGLVAGAIGGAVIGVLGGLSAKK